MGLYRFDEDWNYIQHVLLPIANGTLQLTSWGEKTLVNNSHSIAIQRLSAQGAIEAPLVSTQLKTLISRQQRRASLATAGWLAVLLICGLGAVVSVCTGYLQGLRRFVYKSRRERGAEPLDDYADSLYWIEPMQNRPALLRRRRFSYSLLALAAILVSAGQSVTAWPFVALLIALSRPSCRPATARKASRWAHRHLAGQAFTRGPHWDVSFRGRLRCAISGTFPSDRRYCRLLRQSLTSGVPRCPN